MLSLMPKISWNSRMPAPLPDSGTAQKASNWPPSLAVIVSYLVEALTACTVVEVHRSIPRAGDESSVHAARGGGGGERTMTDVKAMLEQIFEEIINKGNLDAVDDLFTEDYVDHGPMGDLYGRDAFKATVAQWRAAVPDVHCTVETVVTDGETAGWLVRTTGTHTGDGLGFPATGKSFETVSANIGRLRDGKAVEHWAEQGMFPFLVQVGMIPVPQA